MAAPPTPGTFTGALAADIGIVDFDARPSGAELIAAIALDHRLHRAVADSLTVDWVISEPARKDRRRISLGNARNAKLAFKPIILGRSSPASDDAANTVFALLPELFLDLGSMRKT